MHLLIQLVLALIIMSRKRDATTIGGGSNEQRLARGFWGLNDEEGNY